MPPVSLIPVANLPPGVVDTGGNFAAATQAKMEEKFATGVADTGGKFATWCR